jgi:hypothetical protein
MNSVFAGLIVIIYNMLSQTKQGFGTKCKVSAPSARSWHQVQGLGTKVQGLGTKVQGLGTKVQGLGTKSARPKCKVLAPKVQGQSARSWHQKCKAKVQGLGTKSARPKCKAKVQGQSARPSARPKVLKLLTLTSIAVITTTIKIVSVASKVESFVHCF